jgi:predicted Zn-dependent protease
LYQLGRLEEAVPHLKQAADARLLHYPAQYNLGQALMRLGREEEAERYLTRADSSRSLMDQITSAQSAASRNPESVDHWIRLGELFRRAGERDRAVQAFNRAASLDPTNLRVHQHVGEMMLEEGDPEGAIQRFRSILQADRTRTEVWRRLVRAYAAAGDCGQAREAVNTAREMNIGNAELEQVLANTCG